MIVVSNEENLGVQSGSVKWFKPTNKFGFIVPDNKGPDVFLHVSVLKEAGCYYPHYDYRGARTTFEIRRGENGSFCSRIISIDFDQDQSATRGQKPVRLSEQELGPEEMEVKFVDKANGFAFLTRMNQVKDEPDVFVHFSTLRRYRILNFLPGQKFSVVYELSRTDPGHRPVALQLAPL